MVTTTAQKSSTSARPKQSNAVPGRPDGLAGPADVRRRRHVPGRVRPPRLAQRLRTRPRGGGPRPGPSFAGAGGEPRAAGGHAHALPVRRPCSSRRRRLSLGPGHLGLLTACWARAGLPTQKPLASNYNGGSNMKIVVIGGTGLIGSKTVAILRQGGHEVVAASPQSGVNTITGEGLKQAMAGTQVVIDLANSPSFEDEAVLKFFETSGRNLLAAEAEAGVRHHVNYPSLEPIGATMAISAP